MTKVPSNVAEIDLQIQNLEDQITRIQIQQADLRRRRDCIVAKVRPSIHKEARTRS